MKQEGIDTHFIQKRVSNPGFRRLFPAMSEYANPDEFALHLIDKSKRDIDLIHVHGEPDRMGHIAKEVRPDLPVVYDAHDLNSVRLDQLSEDEEKTFEVCDGFVFPSIPYQEASCKLHNIKRPTEVIYSMCNEEVLSFGAEHARINGIVYQGGISESKRSMEATEYHRRDYRVIAEALDSEGIPFFVYPANLGADEEQWSNLGALMMPRLQYEQLMKQLGRFDWGLIGNEVRCNQRSWAMPNKLFEYIAAGIPVISFNTDEVSKFIKEHGLGIAVSAVSEIADLYDLHEGYRENVKKKRALFTMESKTPKLLNFYERVIEEAKPKGQVA